MEINLRYSKAAYAVLLLRVFNKEEDIILLYELWYIEYVKGCKLIAPSIID